MKKKHLVLVAHGSRREASNEEIRQLALKTAESADNWAEVHCGFLELAMPSIPDAIRKCILSGAEEVVVLPCFLSEGRHVVDDIPAEVDIVKSECPDIPIRIAPYIGLSEDLVSLLLNLAEA